MLVSLIPKIGPALGLALDSASDAGAVKTNAVQAGLKGWDLYLYMGIQGLTSAILTKTLGAIPGLSDNAGSLTLKGILKSSVQAGISGVAESKIDLFVTKIFTGEPVKLEEIFNLEEDAMTFLTGMCTAFILNGGKAIIVEYKGQKAKIEVDDLKKCLNEDGTLDVDKLIEKEIKI